MTDLEIIQDLFEKIEREPLVYKHYADAFTMIREYLKADIKTACAFSIRLRELIDTPIKSKLTSTDDLINFMGLRDSTLQLESPYLFDSYIQFLELKKPPEKRLYLPRRRVLKQVVDLFQKLVDDELDEIFISMPPRTGKTTIATFFLTWIMGRDSDLSNLYCSYSDGITTAFYNGVLQIIDDPDTYNWNVVFPKARLVQTNAQNETINIDLKKKYASLTCRSLDGTLNGACDCEGYLVSDDLISGIEQATNPDRLKNAMEKVANDLLTRAKPRTKLIWIGTRWSLIDPIGVRMEMLQNDERFSNVRWEKLNIPALDENDESNFKYGGGVGFTTDKYLQTRSSYERMGDMASWQAQYMGQPIEREGALFKAEDLKFYNGVLPPGEPDRVFMPVDVALGGGDYLSAPVCFQYGDDIYIHDWVFDNSEKNITRPEIVNMIKKYKIQAVNFERNNGGGEYKDLVEIDLERQGIRVHMTATSAPTGKRKEMRIYDGADEIRANFYFLEDGKRSKQYSLAMSNLYSFKITGKNKNDDAPDSLVQALDMIDNIFLYEEPKIFKNFLF